ncbi:MAG: YCF48-related protein [Myxococcota bacterium]|nr:YCF48-related protein [Myxococcota bacterium]
MIAEQRIAKQRVTDFAVRRWLLGAMIGFILIGRPADSYAVIGSKTDISPNFMAVDFFSELAGCAIVGQNAIHCTEDGGGHWESTYHRQHHPQVLKSISFYNAKFGVAVGTAGTILKTEDGGKNWLPSARIAVTQHNDLVDDSRDPKYWPESEVAQQDFTHVYCTSPIGAWIVSTSALFFSADSGKTWVPIYFAGYDAALVKVRFFDDNFGVLLGWSSLWLTQDGGRTWQTQLIDSSAKLTDIFFIDRKHGFVVGEGGTLLKTIDGGITWRTIPLATDSDIRQIVAEPNGRGLIITETELLIKSGLSNWVPVTLPQIEPSGLRSISLLGSSGEYIIVGTRGLVMLSEDKGSIWSVQKSQKESNIEKSVHVLSPINSAGRWEIFFGYLHPIGVPWVTFPGASLDVFRTSLRHTPWEWGVLFNMGGANGFGEITVRDPSTDLLLEKKVNGDSMTIGLGGVLRRILVHNRRWILSVGLILGPYYRRHHFEEKSLSIDDTEHRGGVFSAEELTVGLCVPVQYGGESTYVKLGLEIKFQLLQAWTFEFRGNQQTTTEFWPSISLGIAFYKSKTGILFVTPK